MASPSQPTLLFIPDISGFTEFVSQTEISHSQHIIEELLETIIDADELGLVVSEIEGDAVLFYRPGRAPTAVELLAQVQRMYLRFHGHLRRYETHRICQCGACATASGLTLKFVAHYGEVGQKQVKEHAKLFGREVIVAHRLMKNEVPHEEYVLLTHDLINACETWVEIEQAAWAPPSDGQEEYDSGPVSYCYLPLEALADRVPEPTIEEYGLVGGTRLHLSHDAVIGAPIDLVFDVITDLSFRAEWIPGLQRIDDVNHEVAQPGMSHRCVIKDDKSDPSMVAHDFEVEDETVSFTETDEPHGFAIVYRLHRIGPGSTRIEKHLLLKKNPLVWLLFRVFVQKGYIAQSIQSFDHLDAYCRRLVAEGERHPSRVEVGLGEPTAALAAGAEAA